MDLGASDSLSALSRYHYHSSNPIVTTSTTTATSSAPKDSTADRLLGLSLTSTSSRIYSNPLKSTSTTATTDPITTNVLSRNYLRSSMSPSPPLPTTNTESASAAIDRLLEKHSLVNKVTSLAATELGSTSRLPTTTGRLTDIGNLSREAFNSTAANHLTGTNYGQTTKFSASGYTPATRTTTSAHKGLTTSSSRIQSNSGNSNHMLQQLFDDMRQIEDTVDSIEIPARGRCRVYMAKYGYDPFKQSPNDNPDAELGFNAGDYIMVFDDIDEDGYFIGELMDGRRGFVPSNWLDRLVGEDLFEFQANTLYKHARLFDDDDDDNNNMTSNDKKLVQGAGFQGGNPNSSYTSSALVSGPGGPNCLSSQHNANSCYPSEFYDAMVNQTMNHSNFQHLLAPEDYSRMNDYVNLDDVTEIDDECLSDYERAEAEQMRRAVPPPQRLVLEKQLNKSILISWLHPQATRGTIVSYQVYVDGVLKSTVPSADRTKALLEGVDSTIPHRISVRAIDVSGRHSNDAGCTIVTGTTVPFAPSCVKASHITSDSALISWLPSNSNFYHTVAVNSIELQTVRPGVYKHLINGLTANTIYRVWVRAKPGKILTIDDKTQNRLTILTTYVDFKTLPKSLPDPPVNVQVEAGPQHRSLLVTWLPLTLSDFGDSNGCPVTGYAVFAGHKKLADIDSPSGDHALLDLADLESLHKKTVTVRTKSGENLSQDSMPCQIPDEYLKPQLDSLGSNSKTSGNDLAVAYNSTKHSNRQASHHNALRMSNKMNSDHGSGNKFTNRYSANISHHHRNSDGTGSRHGGTNQTLMSRAHHLTRSLHNLESDIDSRRSSIPQIEVTKELATSDIINNTESYSEEEFENSMRFKNNLRNKHLNRSSNLNRHGHNSRLVNNNSQHIASDIDARKFTSLANTKNKLRPDSVRYFLAMYDYDPATMSPNPDAASEELAFEAGRIIKVYGFMGPDGFYKGELNGRVGFVPSNVVMEVSNPSATYNLKDKTLIKSFQEQQQQRQALEMRLQQQAAGIKRMIALYDYDPQENSPNADTESEIPFKKDDVIHVYGRMDADGFYVGEVERTKQRGLVPSNFLREDETFRTVQHQQQLYNDLSAQPSGNQNQNIMSQQSIVGRDQQGLRGPGNVQTGVPIDSQLIGNSIFPVIEQNQQQQINAGQQINVNQMQSQQPSQVNNDAVRPNSLMLNRNVANNANLLQQQQQQIMQANQFNRPTQQLRLRPQQGFVGNQQNKIFNNNNPSQINQFQQQQNFHQQQQGGMLSNLSAIGKNIIGAATTPRGPNQQQQLQQQQQQQSFQQQTTQMNNQMPLFNSNNLQQTNNTNNIHNIPNNRQQPNSNFIINNSAHLGQMSQQPLQQQVSSDQMQFKPLLQQQMLPQQQFNNAVNVQNRQVANSYQQQFDHHDLDANNNQGGNIINTVKNMFKL